MKEKFRSLIWNLKNALRKVDKRVWYVLLALLVLILIIIIILCLGSKSVTCKQTNDINGVTNNNVIVIKYKKDAVREVETTYDYTAKDKNSKQVLGQIKESIANLQKVYKDVEGVTFKDVKSEDEYYKFIQTIDFKKISDENLAKVGIEKSYSKAKGNYESAGFKCK